MNIFLRSIRKNYIYDNREIYKDFLSIEKFCLITEKLINKEALVYTMYPLTKNFSK